MAVHETRGDRVENAKRHYAFVRLYISFQCCSDALASYPHTLIIYEYRYGDIAIYVGYDFSGFKSGNRYARS